MIETLKESLKVCDFLSPNVELYLDGNNRVKTKFGGLLCLALLLVASIGFGWFVSEVLNYSNYVVSSNKIYEKFHIYSQKSVNAGLKSPRPRIFRYLRFLFT